MIESLPLFSAMNEKPVERPCVPPFKPLTATESHMEILQRVNSCISQVNEFEHRTKHVIDGFMENTKQGNEAFKETLQTMHNTFVELVRNEINTFETNLNSTNELFKNNLDGKVNLFTQNVEKIVDTYRLQIIEICTNYKTQIENHMTAQDGKIAEYKQYMVDNLISSLTTVFNQKIANGEVSGLVTDIFGSGRTFKGSLSYEEIQAIIDATNGDYYYCTTDGHYYQYAENSWIDVGNGERLADDYEAFKLSASENIRDINIELDKKINRIVGKNLFNKNSVNNLIGYYLSVNSNLEVNENYIVSHYIEVEPETDYCYPHLYQSQAYVWEYDENLNPVKGTMGTDIGGNNHIITTTSSTKYIRLSLNVLDVDEIQFEKGASQTYYEAYTEYLPLETLNKNITSNIIGKVNIVNGKNLFNVNDPKIIKGCYLSDDGWVYNNEKYSVSNYIPVKPETSYCYNGNSGSVSTVSEYDANLLFIKATSGMTLDKDIYFTTASDTAFLRVSFDPKKQNIQLEEATAPTEYEAYTELLALTELEKRVNILENSTVTTVKDGAFFAVAETLSNGEVLNIGKRCDVKKNKTLTFRGMFETFNCLILAHGKGVYGGNYVEIDATNIKVYSCYAETTLNATFEHGLTFNDFITVTIKTDNEASKATIYVFTVGGNYTTTFNWSGCNGNMCAESVGTDFIDCSLSWTTKDVNAKTWYFGDSYTSFGSNERLPYHLFEMGCTDCLIAGYPGGGATHEAQSFENLLELGKPKVAVWAMGMNNGDTENAVTTEWLNATSKFLELCERNNIVPVLCTIPTTPTVNNNHKNEWIMASGYRYVDFNKAVGVNENGEWYSGMLAGDNVHPTELGAKTLVAQLLLDVPEMTW